ncbi:HAAS signaling domain-containing protein [Bacillus cytotoxicus]|uniref:DUF1700 domain-containing protein n=1 Tax=Bacillus cereus TaxID=1396 RepID=Q09KJ2_BACCE|nr:DUF1700 domain-containing protein [Bacillus cytotoxicus]ABI52590.1 hypothetical protein [Bacillus cytotoxicus]AWC27827.1 DUF1700 domain-containing protein [Bacillus cytotoxicus]AWC40794.1 DUF1700 domain-containing protein [Bacillus cytotoxicus]AWC48725.1 DUF1700 domain-containing protein [Bacillus cytotoxicus]AWC51896.1 DUF1700 domain-containing protein [Bacillus cytotoxicus]
MNKKEFLNKLSSSLGNIPNSEKNDILLEYETHFISGKQDGKSEEEICKKLGNPKTIAKEMDVTYAINNANQKRSLKNMIIAILSVMSLGLANFICIMIAFFLLLLLSPILLALIVATPLLLLSPLLLVIVGFTKGFHQIHFSDVYSVLIGFFIGLGIAGVSYQALKHLYSLLVKYLKWNVSILKED